LKNCQIYCNFVDSSKISPDLLSYLDSEITSTFNFKESPSICPKNNRKGGLFREKEGDVKKISCMELDPKEF